MLEDEVENHLSVHSLPVADVKEPKKKETFSLSVVSFHNKALELCCQKI